MARRDRHAPGRATLWLGGATLLVLAALADILGGVILVGAARCGTECDNANPTLTGVSIAAPIGIVAIALQAVALMALHQATGRRRPSWVAATRVAAVITATLLAITALVQLRA